MKNIPAALIAGALVLTPFIASAQTRSANFAPGDRVMVVTAVNVRSAANGSILGKQTIGALGTLVGAPKVMGGYTWWNVNYDSGLDGWSAEDFMQSPSVKLVTPGATSPVNQIASPLAAVSSPAAATVATTNVVTNDNVNVRATPGGSLIGTEKKSSKGVTTGVAPQNANGYTWWQVKYADGLTGWSVSDYLTLVP